MNLLVKIILVLIGVACVWCGAEFVTNHTGNMDIIGMGGIGGGVFIVAMTLSGGIV